MGRSRAYSASYLPCAVRIRNLARLVTHQAPAAAWVHARLVNMSTTAEKDPIASEPEHDVEGGPEVEHGHLKELEVDVAKVLEDDQPFDFDSDHSPYPEGMMYMGRGRIQSYYLSASCRARS